MTKTERIVELLRAGKHYHEIAEEIGSTANSVRVLACKARSRDSSVPRMWNRFNNVDGFTTARVMLPSAVVTAFQNEAAVRGSSQCDTGYVLMERVLIAVAKDDLFDAVLG
jgi:hypothetical protein